MIPFQILADYVDVLRKFFLSFLSHVPSQWAEGSKKEILLIPGFTEGWATYDKLGGYLHSLGYKLTYLHFLDGNFKPADKTVKIVKEYIAQHNKRNVILMAHSKGCIIAKLLLDDEESNSRISCVVTIAAPFHGTLWGHLRFLSLNELIPHSDILKRLNKMSKNNSKIYNFYPKVDNHILPNSNLLLESAHNIQINIVGHTRILDDTKLFKEVGLVLEKK